MSFLFPMETLMAEEIDRADKERVERIRKAWEAYYAQGPDPLVVGPGKPNDNTKINYLRPIVNKSVSFLFGEDVGFQLDESKLTQTPEEEYLDATWAANKKATTLHKLALNGGVTGHVFVKIVANAPKTAPFPRLVVLDPETVRAIYDPDDIETVRMYRIEYKALDPVKGPMLRRQDIKEAEGGGSWDIDDFEKRPDAATWTHVDHTPWPFPFAPVVDCQNLPSPNEFWGLSDLEEDIVKVQAALDFAMSNIRKIVRLHGHPKTWGKGFNADVVDLSPEKILELDENGELHNLEMISDLVSALETYRELKNALHDLTRIPPIALGKMEGSGQISGVALRIHYGPLLELTNTKRKTYGDLLVELNRRLLAIGGHGDQHVTKLQWADALPADQKEEAETYLLHQTLGVSKETLLGKLGYDPDTEKKRREAEAQEAADSMARAMAQGTTDDGSPLFGSDDSTDSAE